MTDRAQHQLVLAAFFVVACGADSQTSEQGGIPEVLMEPGAEVSEFSSWQVEGLSLYTINVSEPDMTSIRVVGVDAQGEVVSGRELMQRMSGLAAEELAPRVMGVLLHRAHGRPLMPDSDERDAYRNVWEAVTAPRSAEGKLVFYALEGDMNPAVVRHEIDLQTFAHSSMQASEELRQRGQIVGSGSAVCEPVATCLCWSGCARLEPILAPDGNSATHRRVRPPEEPRAVELYERVEACTGGVCAQTCRADRPDSHCDAGVLIPVDVVCTESCAPSEAPFHCDTLVDSCRRVPHPVRAAASGH